MSIHFRDLAEQAAADGAIAPEEILSLRRAGWGDGRIQPEEAEAIFAINPLTGGLTRSPIDLSPLGSAGANLVATDYGLLVCGPDRLRLLARVEAMAPPEPPEPVSRLNPTVPNIAANSTK